MAKRKPDNKKKRLNFKTIKKFFLLPTFVFLLVVLLFLVYQLAVLDRFYAFSFVGNQNISFLTQDEAIKTIDAAFEKRVKQQIAFNYQNQTFGIDLASSSAKIDYRTLNAQFQDQHSGTFTERVKKDLKTLIFFRNITPQLTFNLSARLDQINNSIKKNPQDAQLLYSEASDSANIQIKDSQDGLTLDTQSIEKEISNYLISGTYQSNLPTKTLVASVQTTNVTRAKEVLENLQKNSLKLKYEGNIWVLDEKTLLTLLDLRSKETVPLDKDKTLSFLSTIAGQIDQDVQEGLFDFNPDTKRVSAFKASQEGRKLNQEQSYNLLTQALANSNPGESKTINLPVETILPKIHTADVNNLGIKELIGQGVSNFTGSIPNRIYNVNLTATKLNGVLVAPGQIFSFNQTVGDISAATGFKQAYVIKEGRTVLDDGGGVCQDSTTLFRAVLNAGLPVVKRTAHAYRVGYYEQGFPPGLDATVFYPSVDFQFKNDTPGYILIQAYTEGLTLYVDLYGTSDGRVATISRSIITNQTPPPPDLHQDDPTLPKGTVKQVDFSAWGANVSFKRTVTRNSETLADEVWRSSYKPWQAIYLVGTQ